ncbi:M20 family peptidase [Robiginitalea sp. SC105]|uniref:M20 family peptidase n=1 Tax=Robiginitalea sp. SC105 TaxID=2762332 RepID=UPI00163A3728|nr:M20 family peptidase [Robiginitalea sp. SC105]MBC2839813.1 M20/M25/M40 family metallo-hydrolase [Robiginitalea sp. SC105]
MKKILLALLGILLILAAILLFNTLTLSSRQVDAAPLAQPELPDAIYERLAGAITYPTISYSEDAVPDSAAFKGFHQFLDSVFPLVHETLDLTYINEYSLLYRWQGSDPGKKPVILMSHQDVVPVDQPTLGNWEAGPFEGAITDEFVIGRGTMDDKGTLMALMESVEMLLQEGYRPARTFYLAFGHDEEVGGSNGAAKIAEYLKAQGVEALMTLDEGGYLAENMVPGVEGTVAVINLAEKGFASFDLIVETNGGHSSQPPEENTIGILAQAIVDLEDNQLPYKMVEPINYQLEYLGPEMPFAQRVAFANPWLFKKPILKGLNAHTTTAPTIIGGGVKNNVIPTVAKATVNFRILPGETIESVQEHIRETVHDTIRIEPEGFLTNPSPVSGVESEGFAVLQNTIRGLFPDAVVVPGLVGGGTDARYFYDVSEDVYRFYPMRLHESNFGRFHGIDEKISKENYAEIIGFTYHLIRNLD